MFSRPALRASILLAILVLLLALTQSHFVSAQNTIQTLQSAVSTNVDTTKAGLANILGSMASLVGLCLAYMGFHKGFLGKDWAAAGTFTVGAVVSFFIGAILLAF